MIYIAIGAAVLLLVFIHIWWVNNYDAKRKMQSDLTGVLNLSRTTYENGHKMNADLQKLAEELQKLTQEQLSRFEKFQREHEFMKAHQHGMDKRIAGLKREVIVTITHADTSAPAKSKLSRENPKPKKSLLNRAGVTQ